MSSDVSIADQVKCAKRELGKRRVFYPQWVASGRLRAVEADKELAAMAAIVETLTELEKTAPGGQEEMKL